MNPLWIHQSNYVEYRSPQYRHLSVDQVERLHDASLEILARTGVRLHHRAAVDIMKKAGATVEDGNQVHIPAGLVEWALGLAPKRVVLCNRYGQRVMPLERNRVFYGVGLDCPYILDHRTGERRKGTIHDLEEAVRICDALPSIDFVMPVCLLSDIRPANGGMFHDIEAADRRRMAILLGNTVKPILFDTATPTGCAAAVELAEAVVGGAEALQRNPLCGCRIKVSDPLRHDAEALDKLLLLAQKGLPFTYTTKVLRGINGPVTGAGAIALANAGNLVGIVLAQLVNEGTPVIHGGGFNDLMDMSRMVEVLEAPENRGGSSELARHYRLPVFGLAGSSDAKQPDPQGAAEAAFALLIETLLGVNLIHGVGCLEGGECYSLEHLVICDELISYIKRFVQGPEVNEETLALDIVHQLGHGDGFLGSAHTRTHFREDWYPRLLDRDTYEGWCQEGRRDVRFKAREKIENLLGSHLPEPLAADVRSILDEVMLGAAQISPAAGKGYA
jgi:trimethylamine--corrinoid protein Co-methyltransferase